MERIDGWVVTHDEARFLRAAQLIDDAEKLDDGRVRRDTLHEAGTKLQSLDQPNLTTAAWCLSSKVTKMLEKDAE